MKKQIKIGLLFFLVGLFSAKAYAQTWSLKQCVDTAIVNNAKIKISEHNVLLSEEKQKEVKANLLPKVTANGNYKYYTNLPTQLMPLSAFGGPEGFYKEAQFGVQHNLLGNIQFGMPIYNPNLYGGIEKVKIAKEISEVQVAKTKEGIYFQVANTYYNAQIIASQLMFIEDNLANAHKLLNTMKLLKEQGLAQEINLKKIELQISQTETKKNILEGKYRQAINGLIFLMGLPDDFPLEIESKVTYTESKEEESKPSTLDAKLLDTKNRLLISELTTLKRTRFLPSASLFGSFGKMGYGYTKPQPMGGGFYTFYNLGFVGAQVSIPIFNGTVTNKKINQKRIEMEINSMKKELIIEQNALQLKNALQQRSDALNSIKDSEKQIKIAQEIYDKTLIQQQQGIASITDALLADNAINEAQKNYLNAVIDYLKAELEINKRTGKLVQK